MTNKDIALAELYRWDGNIEKQFILISTAQDIADAIEGQYLYIDNITGLTVNGCSFRQINVYQIDDADIPNTVKQNLLKGIKENERKEI